MSDDQGAGVTLVEILEQLSHRRLLRCRTRVVGLTADVELTTDHVVVADAKLIMAVFAVPGINLSGRRCLVGPYCRTMND